MLLQSFPKQSLSIALVLAACAFAPTVRAQGNNKIAAEALFEEGRKMLADNNAAQACPKFAESQRLDPSPSTLLNLASCYEKLGKTASAWATYREAASSASTTPGRQNLVPVAQKHAATLDPLLSRVSITGARATEGIEVKRDGVIVGRGEWDVAIPVDPGPVVVEATAPKKKPWTTTVEVREAGKTVTVTVPPLEDAPVTDAPVAPVTPAPVAPQPGAQTTPTSPEADSSGGSQRTIGLIVGGVGVVGLAVGTVFLVQMKSKYDDSLKECPVDKNKCTPDGTSLRDDARSAGNVATVAYGVGLAALAAGAVLYFTAPKRSTGKLTVTPTLGGISVGGQWL